MGACQVKYNYTETHSRTVNGVTTTRTTVHGFPKPMKTAHNRHRQMMGRHKQTMNLHRRKMGF
jgi:hypothetical protein